MGILAGRMSRLLLICLGGAVGTAARYLVAASTAGWVKNGFPLGTLLINIVGSLLIAVVMGLTLKAEPISAELRFFLVTGVLGGFTTYSSFSYESVALVQRGAWGLAAAYMALTLVGGFTASWLGLWAVR